MSDKLRILFSIETGDPWILRAYKSFFDSLAGQPYEILCTACDVNEPVEQLAVYNIIDYAKISDGIFSADGLAAKPDEQLVKDAQRYSLWFSPEWTLRQFNRFRRVFDMVQPDMAIVWNGMADIRRMVRDFLIRQNTPLFYAEKGMLPESWYIDEMGINANCSLGPAGGGISEAERNMVLQYVQGIINSGASAWKQPGRISKNTLRDKLSIKPESPVIFFPGQVDADTNITEFSCFRNVAEAVEAVATVMPTNTIMVVKPHPKSKDQSRLRLKELAGRFPGLRIVTDVNVWDIIDIADMVISINSTVAFESLLRKRKVLLLGDGVLSKAGLVRKTEIGAHTDAIRRGFDGTFDDQVDYGRVLSFVKFLLNDYYLFAGSGSVPRQVLSRINSRASKKSDRTVGVAELLGTFYHDSHVFVPYKPAIRESVPSAVDYFRFALGEFNAGNFQKATEFISAYEKSIDFSKFPRQINRSRKKESIDVSVVVVTYNRTDDLKKCLESLAKQNDQNFEVIAVDNGGTDFEQIKRYVDQYIKCPINFNLSEGRNIGTCCAKGEIVVFLDDDALVPSNYISSIKAAFDTYDIYGLRGRALPKTQPDANSHVNVYNRGDKAFCTFCNQEGNSAFLRRVYLSLGGMDPLLFGHEGNDLTYRIIKQFNRQDAVIYWPETVIYHDYGQGERYQQKQKIYQHNANYLKFKHNAYIWADQKDIEQLPLPLKVERPDFKYDELNRRLLQKSWKSKSQLYKSCFESVEYLKKVQNPAISIIVVSYRLHPDTLENFKVLQRQRSDNFELIFVNNGCRRNEFELLMPFIDTYVELNKNTGAYLSRNIGAVFANAPVLLFLEDDGIPEADFVREHLRAFAEYEAVAVRGPYLSKTKSIGELPKYYYLGDKPFPYFSCQEGNSSYNADLFYKVGGWDDQIVRAHGGIDLSRRLVDVEPDMRKQIYYPSAVIYHEVIQDQQILEDKRKKQIISWERLQCKHPGFGNFMKSWDKFFQRPDLLIRRIIENRQFAAAGWPPSSDTVFRNDAAILTGDLKLSRLGSEYGSSVVVLDLIAPESTIISAGVGEDISFDLELIKQKGCKVIGIDPTDKAKTYVEKIRNENYVFLQKALFSQNRNSVMMYRSSRPDYVSESVTRSHRSVVSSDCYEAQTISIEELLKEYSDISLLKMDIEGAEYDVLNSIEKLNIPQIYVEFHHFCTQYSPQDTYRCIEHVKALGYELVHCENKDGAPREATFVHRRCLSPNAKSVLIKHIKKIETTPIVVIAYNRPKHTLEVLKALKRHDIKNIYIFSDAPKRKEHEQDVSLVRRLIHSIDWTTPEIIERSTNFGLAKSIVSAADYVFEKHDQLILLEDDCVPQQYFFDFIYTCLEKYRDNPKVFGISGHSVSVPDQLLQKYPYDLYFSPRIGSWGWATWKRAWQHYGRDLRKLVEQANEKGIDLSQGGTDIPISIEKFLTGQLSDVWTLNWVLSVYLNNGFYVYPTRSHVKNIGTDGTGLHCGKTEKYDSPCAIEKPSRYPGDRLIDNGILENFRSYFQADKEQSRRATTFLTSIGRKNPESKIAIVSTTDNRGGAAKVAWMLKKKLADRGLQTRMFVKDKYSDDADVLKITNPSLDRDKKFESQGLLYYDIKSTALLAHNYYFTGCDVFHFHNLHGGYFNPFTLAGLSRLKPSVWTLHDMQGLTGHCAHSFDCLKWQTGCGNCPNLEIYPAIAADQTARMWNDKRRIYEDCDIELIVPSLWLKNIVEKSILKDKKVHLIYNGIDEKIFRPWDKSSVRRHFQLPEDAIVIGFVSPKGLVEQFKGGNYILKAYNYLASKYPNLYFLCVGGKAENVPTERFIQIPFVTDETVLAQIYCAADLFMYPSVADNCPLIVLELMGCGVPIVSFEVGGVPELIEHGKTGFLAPYKNIGELIHLTEQLVLDEAGRRRFGQAAVARLREHFTLNRMIDNHIRLYDSLTQNRPSGQPGQGDEKPVVSTGKTSKQNRYLVSAIVSTYNSEKFIRGCLEDLESQTIADKLEIIVINSASEQNEELVVKEFQKRYSNIVYVKTDEREGLYSAWNRAVNIASGQFLTNANTDDRHRKDALEVMVNTLIANPDVALVYGDQIVTDTPNPTFENHHVIELAKKPEFSKERLLFGCCVGSQPMWRKSLHAELGGFDETLTCAADWDFWLKVAGRYSFKHIPEFLGLYYHNKDGIEHGRRIHSLYERYAVGRRYNKQYISLIPLYEAHGNPLVSIVMAAYNAAGYIARAIESVLIQNYRNFELIVVDDGSTDRTAEIVRGFKNEPIKYFYKENGGVASARNYALKKAGGSFVVILDSDDMITPDFLARHLMVFEEHPETDLVYCDDCFIDENDKPIRVMGRPEYSDQKALISELFRYGWAILPFRTCIRKSVFDKIGLYDERLIMSEDYDMVRRFVGQGLRMRHLPAALYLRHPTANSLSRSFNAAKAKGHFEVVRRFTETFTAEQLFPDVHWENLPAEQKLLLAKCKTVLVYLGIGEQYLASNAPDFAEAAFEMACAEMDDCCKIEPANQQVRNLREKCQFIRDKRLSNSRRNIYQQV